MKRRRISRSGPKRPRRAPGALRTYHKSDTCLNCGTVINQANYCPQCGQLNSDRRIPVGKFVHDFLGDFLAFDSRFFRSIFPLLARPGYLTRAYLDGRRVSYIFPFRLYLFTIFLFFFIVAVSARIDRNNMSVDQKKHALFPDTTLTEILQQHIADLPAASRDGILADLDSSFILTKKNPKKDIKITILYRENPDHAVIKYLHDKISGLYELGKEGERRFFKELFNQFPKIMFLLLPVFALILKLLYIRNTIFYIEHLVFALHFHTIVFILLILTLFFPVWYVIIPVILVILLQLFLSMKHVYRQNMIKTLIKMNLLILMYMAVMPLAFGILALLAIIST